jgi:pterin-4a-carbinolamine dehydratase
MSNQWHERIRPLRLERRYEFPDYDSLRDFLDQAAEISEREGLFPDLGFGRDYVNVTIHSDDDVEAMSETQRRLAAELDALFVDRKAD